MKLSNFKFIKEIGEGFDKRVIASVDVTTGIFFKKIETKLISRKAYFLFWIFVDTGQYTPGRQAECLANIWEIQKDMSNSN